MNYVGQRMRRVEDARLLTGSGLFVDDVDRPNQTFMRVIRSTVAHGSIASVDISEAANHAGVLLAWTAEDVHCGNIPVRVSPHKERLDPYLQPVLARDRVRYVGEPLAIVVAEDPYIAEDASELVVVDYSRLTPVLEVDASAVEGEDLFPGWPNQVIELVASFGDVKAAFASCDFTVTFEGEIGRQTGVPIETRGLVAEWKDGNVEIWGATKVPHFNRRVLADLLGIEVSRIRMYRMDAGGGFGVRGELYPEDILVVLAARELDRPVKWIEDRAEHFLTTNHSRAQRHHIVGAFRRDGELLGLQDEVWHDNGAYIRTHGVTVPELTISMLPGPYRLPAYEGRVHVVVSNKTPCGTYRAPGRFEGTFVRERLFDVAASQLGLDPVEIRRRNLLTLDELPLDRGVRALGTDVVLDRGDYPGLLDRALLESRYEEWKRDAAEASADGRRCGTGVAVFLEKSGLGPYECSKITVSPEGRICVAVGGTSLGQGIETIVAQIAADELGADPEGIDVVAGDTDELEDGTGSWASRSTVLSGGAVTLAARETAEKLRFSAASLFEAAPADVRLEHGRAYVAGSPEHSVSFAEIVRTAVAPVAGVSSGSESFTTVSRFEVAHMTYPYGVHLAEVEIDEETGGVSILQYFVAYEVGRAINPNNVEGQLVGGAVQGIGGALLEEMVYDAEGQPLSASLMDYCLPFATEAPSIGLLVTEDYPSTTNPLGARGAGEGGLTACGAAIASAVSDALGDPGAACRLPLTPAVTRALAEGCPGSAKSWVGAVRSPAGG